MPHLIVAAHPAAHAGHGGADAAAGRHAPAALKAIGSTCCRACWALAIAIGLLLGAAPGRAGGRRRVPAGNWPAPFGIVLVADRLSAMMLLLTSVLGLAARAVRQARWHRRGCTTTRCSSSS
jgi:formate hydrogenlyase subunit 3/multisubunit Na+/H+ antiporter MnhD subunit